MQDILALGAIFATTDSVAVLQVLNKDRSPILFSLVFGEGVINDAAGVALLRAIQVCLSLASAQQHQHCYWHSMSASPHTLLSNSNTATSVHLAHVYVQVGHVALQLQGIIL